MEHVGDGGKAPPAQERPTGELIKLLSEQVSVLVRDELKLARLEMTRKGKRAGMDIGMQARHLVDRAVKAALTTSGVATIVLPEDVQEEEAVASPPHMHGSVFPASGGPGPGSSRPRRSCAARPRSSTRVSGAPPWPGTGSWCRRGGDRGN